MVPPALAGGIVVMPELSPLQQRRRRRLPTAAAARQEQSRGGGAPPGQPPRSDHARRARSQRGIQPQSEPPAGSDKEPFDAEVCCGIRRGGRRPAQAPSWHAAQRALDARCPPMLAGRQPCQRFMKGSTGPRPCRPPRRPCMLSGASLRLLRPALQMLVLFGLPALVLVLAYALNEPKSLAVAIPLALIIPGPRGGVLSTLEPSSRLCKERGVPCSALSHGAGWCRVASWCSTRPLPCLPPTTPGPLPPAAADVLLHVAGDMLRGAARARRFVSYDSADVVEGGSRAEVRAAREAYRAARGRRPRAPAFSAAPPPPPPPPPAVSAVGASLVWHAVRCPAAHPAQRLRCPLCLRACQLAMRTLLNPPTPLTIPVAVPAGEVRAARWRIQCLCAATAAAMVASSPAAVPAAAAAAAAAALPAAVSAAATPTAVSAAAAAAATLAVCRRLAPSAAAAALALHLRLAAGAATATLAFCRGLAAGAAATTLSFCRRLAACRGRQRGRRCLLGGAWQQRQALACWPGRRPRGGGRAAAAGWPTGAAGPQWAGRRGRCPPARPGCAPAASAPPLCAGALPAPLGRLLVEGCRPAPTHPCAYCLVQRC